MSGSVWLSSPFAFSLSGGSAGLCLAGTAAPLQLSTLELGADGHATPFCSAQRLHIEAL